MMNGFDDFQKFGRDNVEATTKSASAVGKGWQTLASEAADYSRRSIENGSAAFEKMLGVTSLDKALEVQSEFARGAYEGYISQVTKVGGIVADVAKDAYKPFEALFGRMGR